eukprot:gene336-170_t
MPKLPLPGQNPFIQKAAGVAVDELEEEVVKALKDIQSAPSTELKAELREFTFSGAKAVECPGAKNNKSAVVMFVPYRCWRELSRVKTVIPKLIRELEKKFPKKHVIIVANRTIMDKNFRRKGIQVRPRNRTLTAVHESILEDVVAPTEIVGKRTRVAVDGSKLMKIQLDKKEKDAVEEKLQVFSSVYRTLTNKEAVFHF